MLRIEDMMQNMMKRFDSTDENVKEMRNNFLESVKNLCTFGADQET